VRDGRRVQLGRGWKCQSMVGDVMRWTVAMLIWRRRLPSTNHEDSVNRASKNGWGGCQPVTRKDQMRNSFYEGVGKRRNGMDSVQDFETWPSGLGSAELAVQQLVLV
jgi:hypothetical protein